MPLADLATLTESTPTPSRPPIPEIDDLALLHRSAASAERMLLEHFEYMEELPECPATHQLNETIDILARLTAIRKSLIRLHRAKQPIPGKIEQLRQNLSSANAALATLVGSESQATPSPADSSSAANSSSSFPVSSTPSVVENPALEEPSFTAPPVPSPYVTENAVYYSGLEPRPPYFCNHGEFAFSAPDPEPSIREIREIAVMPLDRIQPALDRVNDALEDLPRRPVSPGTPPQLPFPELTPDGRLPWVAFREYEAERKARKLREEKAKAKKSEERGEPGTAPPPEESAPSSPSGLSSPSGPSDP
ncbi:hypothetical protein LLG95_09850 [bacterium]|nr:hypothetical protein [bacterium]